MRRVLDHRNPQGVVVSEVADLVHALSEPLDLLNVVDLEDLPAVSLPRALRLEQQRDQDGPLRMGVDAAAGTALGEGREEERRALRGLVSGGRAEVCPVAEGSGLRCEGEDVNVGSFHELLLHTRRRNVDEIAVPVV